MTCNPCCEALFAQASCPRAPICGRGVPARGLLAHVVGRQNIAITAALSPVRESMPGTRSICNRFAQLTDLGGAVHGADLEPLANHIGQLVRAGPASLLTNTPRQMQTKGKTERPQTRDCGGAYVRGRNRPWRRAGAALCVVIKVQRGIPRGGAFRFRPSWSGYKGVVHCGTAHTGPSQRSVRETTKSQRAGLQWSMCAAKFCEIYEREGSARRGGDQTDRGPL